MPSYGNAHNKELPLTVRPALDDPTEMGDEQFECHIRVDLGSGTAEIRGEPSGDSDLEDTRRNKSEEFVKCHLVDGS